LKFEISERKKLVEFTRKSMTFRWTTSHISAKTNKDVENEHEIN
jgi:hypothetical protein